MSAFSEAFQHVVGLEGGYTDDPADSGGQTKFGISFAVARESGYGGEMKDLTEIQAREIYRKRYWDALHLDAVAAIDYPLALKIFDAGVNVGTGKVAEWVQRALNVLNNEGAYWPDLKADGDLGAKTLSAIQALFTRRGADGMAVLRRAVNCFQGHHYLALAERRKKDERFVYGWLKQRVN